jgi:transmembrane sensor
VILTRRQAGDLHKATGMVSGMQNNNPNFLAWKTKEFCFDQHSLGSVFEALANVYHFTYTFEQDDVKKIRLSTHFKQMPLTEIFRIIALTTNVTIAKRNGMYFIKKS